MSAWQAVAIDRGDVGVRVDRVLLRHLRHLPGASRNRLQRLITAGSVHLNGRPVTRSSSRIAAGDRLAIEMPERQPRAAPIAESLPLEILIEDDDLMIVNKPAGQVSHPAFRNTSGTLLNALLAHAAGAWTPALISRLDKGTSGLVLVAKRRAVQAALQRLSQENGLEKDYVAIVAGRPPARGTIDVALDRDPWDRRRVTVRDRGGVPSVTRFTRLATLTDADGGRLSLLRCRLITGRTHQIRVHLAAKGWPIIGDTVYGRSDARMTRQALHAWRLAFDHPSGGRRIEVVADLPADMRAVVPYSALASSRSTVASAE